MSTMSEGQVLEETRGLPSMMERQLDLQSHNSDLTSYSSFLSDQTSGSHTGDSFNGFDHQEAHRINNADKTDMLNHDLEFDSIQKRLDSFKRWPVDNPIEPHDLAAAGFYSTGVDDRVVCFKCDLHLKQWKAGDDPWNEHKKFRPRCPFVLECEGEIDYEVTCSPVEASSNSQKRAQISLSQNFPRYGEPAYPQERLGGQREEEVYGTRISSSYDPRVVLSSERPQYVTQAGGYGYHEQPYLTHPIDAQTGYRDQQAYYAGRRQQFPGKDPRSMQPQHPEHQRIGTEVTKHVVVGQGYSQVHIVGSGAAVYKVNPEDKLYIHSGGQGHPQQVRSVRDLTPVYTEANQPSRLPSKLETSFTGSRESNQYSSEESMSGRYHPPPSTVSYPPSYPGQYAKHPGYEYSGKENSSDRTGALEGGNSLHQFQGGSETAKFSMQQYQGMQYKQEQLKYNMNTVHESSVPKHTPFSQKVPGQTYYEPYSAEKKVSNEDELLQESCYRPQQYPGTKSETRVPVPSQPPRETTRWQEPPGHSAQGSRRPTPLAAFPVKDPSLQPAQPLIRYEDARHITSSSDLASEHHRLTTFRDWPHDHPLHPCDLAAAGFYYLGTGDSVKCFKCSIPLHNWDPTDTPWGEHQKWSPRCPLVLEHITRRPRQREERAIRQSVTPQERYTSPQEGFQYGRPESSQGASDRQMPIRSGDRQVHNTWTRPEQFPAHAVSSVVRPQNLPLEQQPPQWPTRPLTTSSEEGHVTSSQQTSSTSELGSSQDPRSCSPRGSTALEFDVERLAEMGFTQQQINDAVKAQVEATRSTFSSSAELVSALLENQGRQLTNQTRPQPTRQGCEAASPPPPMVFPFVSSRPQDFEGRNCVSVVTSPTTPLPDKSSLRRSFSEPAPWSSESGEESLEEKLERMQEERMCKICMDAEVSVVFLPCGHLSCCAECANGMDLCPMCRAPIQEKIRTFLS